LPNCFFLIKELNKVQQAALHAAPHAFLAKSGFNRDAQRSIVFALIWYGGQILTFLNIGKRIRMQEISFGLHYPGPTSSWH
jgi:hypothetical protein